MTTWKTCFDSLLDRRLSEAVSKQPLHGISDFLTSSNDECQILSLIPDYEAWPPPPLRCSDPEQLINEPSAQMD